MSLQQIIPPIEEPISLTEAKLHLRVDSDEDDALISTLISTARQSAEMLTNRQLVTAYWRYTIDHFPSAGQAIVLPKSPLQFVTSIYYLDVSGMWQFLSMQDYIVDIAGEPPRITLAFGKHWPLCLLQAGSASITFIAGYGLASQVPEGIKTWIKLRVGSLYACREELSVARSDPSTAFFFNGLLT